VWRYPISESENLLSSTQCQTASNATAWWVLLWGKRQNEGSGRFPNGGWARLDSIKLGKWKPWHPRPVLIPADSFLEKDHDNQSHWIKLESGMVIQALLAERNDECRVYIVTEETPSQYHWIHDRWPRLIRLSDQNKTAMEHT
jgi:putative SOS response-associated peptidase YedK